MLFHLVVTWPKVVEGKFSENFKQIDRLVFVLIKALTKIVRREKNIQLKFKNKILITTSNNAQYNKTQE